MEQTKLNRLIDDLRSDVDMLLNNHYDLSESGVAGMRENISQITTKIESIQRELTQTHEQAIITAQNLMAYDIQYTNHTERAYSLSNDLEQYFKDFLEYFLNATEKTKDYDLEDRIKVLKPVMTKVRDHLDNLINGDGSQISSADFEELSSTVDDLQDTCQSLTTKCDNLQLQLNKYITPPDPYYVGKSYSDYPAGTIFKSYDFDERDYYFETTNRTSLTTPTIYFCTEIGADGSCTITHTLAVQNTTNVCIKTYLNGTLFDERLVAMEAGTEQQNVSYTLYELPLNQESRANNIYCTVQYQGTVSENIITYTHIKTEISAPNADILNKLCPLDAIWINGKYYLTDCTTGHIKTFEIDEDQMHNTDTIEWTDTGIEAMECKTTHNMVKYNFNFKMGTEVYKFKRTKDFKLHAGQLQNNFESSTLTYEIISFDSVNYPQIYPTCCYGYQNASFGIYLENGAFGTFITEPADDLVKTKGIKVFDKLIADNFYIYGAYIMKDGRVCIKRKGINYPFIELGYGSDATIYLEEYTTYNNLTLNVYVKRFDKIILYKVKVLNGNFTVTETIEVGSYDLYFEMPNDKYFVIKNNQLKFYNKNHNETSEDTTTTT